MNYDSVNSDTNAKVTNRVYHKVGGVMTFDFSSSVWNKIVKHVKPFHFYVQDSIIELR